MTLCLCVSTLAKNEIHSHKLFWKDKHSSSSLIKDEFNLRTYKLQTNNFLRDNFPASRTREITENKNFPVIRTGSNLFDSIYTMSIEELVENSVEQISDHAFITSDCHCFETGKKWKYVWTRDISYSAHLSLAALEQRRTKNSLLFKISKMRGLDERSLEIIQDTGTGGSWPVSTDRVIWSLASSELLKYLEGNERREFLNKSYTALKNTVDHDRMAIYDYKDGLYSGEMSFLDWREQSYPNWVKENVIHVAMSKTLSTNIAHQLALKNLSFMALELGKINQYEFYARLASDLKSSINYYFWDQNKGLYKSLITTYLDTASVDKFDLLGSSMAVLFEIAETKEQKESLRNYPMVKAGASVLWPQDQEAPIYHNRAIWPFVSSYALLAAKKEKQADIYNHMFESLIRGSALNLSNMENFEFLSLGNWVDDGNRSGPVVNSQRQLWSVAAMLSLNLDGVFGKEVNKDAIRFTPFITEKMRNTIFKNSNALKLTNFKYHNKFLNITITLPKKKNSYKSNTYFKIKSVSLNGQMRNQLDFFTASDLRNSNQINIILGETTYGGNGFNLLDLDDPHGLGHSDFEKVFAPLTPSISSITFENEQPVIRFNHETYRNITFNIYRNGTLIASKLRETTFSDSGYKSNETPCYTVEAEFKSSYNRSQHSEPQCYWAPKTITTLPVTGQGVRSNSELHFYSEHGKLYLRNWGKSSDVLEFNNQSINKTGNYALQLNYSNLGIINTGITAAVKKIEVLDENRESVIFSGVFTMPHHNSARYWTDSNFVNVKLEKGQRYTFRISDFYNMSYFEHFMNYLYRGGRMGVYNRVNISELKLLLLGLED
ncbi:hypothetical protein A9Q84_01025 [Halobacteriovorax marinus]|uniref:Alpha-L-rhamnosidase six-hairpin glycosidase domain-containing protein n=1 Tax=Halobacteriovorax marinus TaxID=97084 RepID=A0A1Y5FHH4_9BACT|nr:hypothetical protein A9Q84_01025 [Halobacteriovorax marinus]